MEAPGCLPTPRSAAIKTIARSILHQVIALKPILYRYLQGNKLLQNVRKKDLYMSSWENHFIPENSRDRTELFKLVEAAYPTTEDLEKFLDPEEG